MPVWTVFSKQQALLLILREREAVRKKKNRYISTIKPVKIAKNKTVPKINIKMVYLNAKRKNKNLHGGWEISNHKSIP